MEVFIAGKVDVLSSPAAAWCQQVFPHSGESTRSSSCPRPPTERRSVTFAPGASALPAIAARHQGHDRTFRT
jgi:hypothetical protein